MKICKRCGEEKELEDFGSYTIQLKGYRKRYTFSYCKPCHRMYNNKYRAIVTGKGETK